MNKLLTRIFGRRKQSPPSFPPDHPNTLMIDYSRESRGVHYYGRATLIRSKVRVTCIFWEGGIEKSRDVSMTEETFRSLWDSLNQIADFKTVTVASRRPDQQWTDNQRMGLNDSKIYYGIETYSTFGGGNLYKIPADTSSPAFKDWLRTLGYTGE